MKGLYYNVNKKRKEGRTMRSKGDKGAPTDEAWAKASKTAKTNLRKAAKRYS
jgi:hypothetical protein